MTLALDTSALVAAVVEGANRRIVLDALAAEPHWCACALALTEALVLVDRLTDEPVLRDDIEDELRLLWDRVAVVPLDQTCLDRAASLARAQPVRLADALHLAAADRLPRPVRFATFDPAQIPVALALGFDVVSA
ncbi:MAG: type II toxin-antitoxin system VapC family toxin [Actinomycetota bacterium]|nr:MAG: type II toxin-antitoxin system VapC family toxin [Actinomycetota bacterium]